MTSFLIGLAASRIDIIIPVWLILVSAYCLLLFRRARFFALVFACVVVFGLGSMRGAAISQRLSGYDTFIGQKVVLHGIVNDDPRYADRGQTEFHVDHIVVNGEHLPGSVRIRTFRAIGLLRGDTIEATGKLFKGYGSRQGGMSFVTIEVTGRSSNPVERVRRQYFAGVYSSIPEPQASLGLGFLVGLRALLPDILLDDLSATGLTHIVAVSGYNLTVLIRLTRRWFMRYSRFISLAMSLGLMGLFLLVTGGAASIIRASVVATTALFGWYFGRTIHPLVLLLFSAVVTAGINPLFIWFDLGWWLSFLAFFGVLIVGPAIEERFIKRKLKMLGQTLLETASAQIMALPLIMSVFGELSVISLLANMLILPLIPLAMLLTFIAGSAGVIIPRFAGWLAWPATQILSFMTSLISLLARIPGAVTDVEIKASSMYGFYFFIIVLLFVTRKKRRSDMADLI